jgi:para-nitrobenzyl esterase
VFIPGGTVTADGYQPDISPKLGVTAAGSGEYPPGTSPDAALSTLVSDANFACLALQIDQGTSQQVPTFAYEFNDDNAPNPYAPPLGVATHESELPYLFDLPNAPNPPTLNPDQQTLAASMRTAWTAFATRHHCAFWAAG